MTHYTLMDAWQQYEAGNYELAAQIWQALIKMAPDQDSRRNHELGYSYVLVGQRNFVAARELLQRLYEETQESSYLHQLGLVEREAGDYDAALRYLEQERAALAPEDHFRIAVNAYELGLIAFKQEEGQKARQYAETSLKSALKMQDAMSEGCARRLLGDLAAASGDSERARSHYADARLAFRLAQDSLAVKEIEIRLDALD